MQTWAGRRRGGLLLLRALASNALTETFPDGNIRPQTVRLERQEAIACVGCLCIGLLLAGFCLTLVLSAQNGARNGEWRAYGGDEGSTRYSPLDQINRDNVKNLQVAWTWKFDNFGATNRGRSTRPRRRR